MYITQIIYLILCDTDRGIRQEYIFLLTTFYKRVRETAKAKTSLLVSDGAGVHESIAHDAFLKPFPFPHAGSQFHTPLDPFLPHTELSPLALLMLSVMLAQNISIAVFVFISKAVCIS